MAKGKGFGKNRDKNQDGLGVFSPLPAGEYPCVVRESFVEKTKSGDGQNHVIQYEVIKGPEKGRTFKDWICFDNPNEKAVDIADQTTKSLCDATGIAFVKFKDPKMVLKKKLNLVLTVTSGDKKFGPGNSIRQYKEYSAKVKAEKDKGKKKKKGKNKPF